MNIMDQSSGGPFVDSVQQHNEDVSVEAAGLRRQGSMRRVLSSLPGASDSAQRIDRPGLASGIDIRSTPQFAPYFLEYSLIPEFNLLESCRLPGVYVMPAAKSALTWFGVMFVRQGLYAGGVFRFTLHIPENFPNGGPPKLSFQSSVFHPQVCPVTGLLNLSLEFPDWNKSRHHLWQVVDYARRCFIKIQIDSATNVEAAKLLESDPEQFEENISECVKKSKLELYDPPPTDDPHYLTFEPFDDLKHRVAKLSMLSPEVTEEDHPSSPGLSWVAPGSLKPFSKSPSSFSDPLAKCA